MSLRKSNTAKGDRDCPKTTRGYPWWIASLFLCLLNLAQCLAELVGTRCRSVTASDTFQFLDDILYLHSLHQCPDALEVSVASSPEEKLGYYTVFHFQFDVATTSALRLISKFLYHDYSSSAGFIKLLIITVSILFYYLCCKINQKFYFYNEKSSIIIEM